MNQDEFYHISDIQNAKSFFIHDGWMPIYRCGYSENEDSIKNWHRIYGYMIDADKIEKCLSSYMQDIEINERIAVYGDGGYKSFSKDGIEPLVVVNEFHFKSEVKKQIRVSEELIFYFNLYEECENELLKTYYYIENGNKIAVIKVSGNLVIHENKTILNLHQL